MTVLGILVAQLSFEILLPDTVRRGQVVQITLRLTNFGPKPSTVYLGGRPTAFDILVSRPDGKPVWRRLHHVAISAILQVRELGPGDALEFTDTWNQQDDSGHAIPPGEYRVTGVLPGDLAAELRTETVEFKILP